MLCYYYLLSCAYTYSPSPCPRQPAVLGCDPAGNSAHGLVPVCAATWGHQWEFSGKPFVSTVIFRVRRQAQKSWVELTHMELHRSFLFFFKDLFLELFSMNWLILNIMSSKGNARTNDWVDSSLAYVCSHYFTSTDQAERWEMKWALLRRGYCMSEFWALFRPKSKFFLKAKKFLRNPHWIGPV